MEANRLTWRREAIKNGGGRVLQECVERRDVAGCQYTTMRSDHMKKFRLIGLLGLAVLAVSAFGASSAFAAVPVILPVGETATSSAGATEFGEGLFAIKSSGATGTVTGEAGSGSHGTFTFAFTGSKDSIGRTCTGLSDTVAGTVTVTGTFLTRFLLPVTPLKAAIVLSINEVHLSCGTQLIRVKGSVAGEITTALNTAVTLVTLVLETNGKGDNTIIEVDNEAQTGMESAILLASIGTGAFSLTSQKATVDLTAFKPTSTIEVMG
jgi:hypothetical protein